MKSDNKVAVVSGASYGIGRSIAIGLAKEGYDLVISARGKQGLEETAALAKKYSKKVIICQMDITKEEDISNAVKMIGENFPHVDLLWNGASGFSEESLETATEEEIVSLVDTIVKGNILLTKAMLDLLKRAKKSLIINMLSDWAVSGSVGPAPFSAAKFALSGFGEAIGKELIVYGISVSNIYAGDIAANIALGNLSELENEHGISMISVDDVVNTIVYLTKLQYARVPKIELLPLDPGY